MITADETRAATLVEASAVLNRYADEVGVESEYGASIVCHCADLVAHLGPENNMGGDLARFMWLIAFIEEHKARSGAQILTLLREQSWAT